MEKVLKNLLVQVRTLAHPDRDRNAAIAEVEAFEAQKNANEVMNTTAVGAGKELVPAEVMGDALLGLVPNYSFLLPLLPGNHGSGLEMKEVLPVIGEAGLFSGNTEWTTGAGTPNTPTGRKVATGSVTIEQGQFILEIAVSKRELAYSMVVLEPILRERINQAAARTVDALFLNADSATSGNINYDGGTPATGEYYLQGNNGLRKLGLGNSVDVGTFDEADFLAMFDALDEYAADPSQLLFVTSRKVYNKMLGFTNVKTYDKAAQNATIFKGVLANLFGVDILVHRDVPSLATADGKVSTTGASNTTGTGVMFYKPAVQFGFGKVEDFEVTPVAGKGAILTSTFEFGFGIPNQAAGLPKMVTAAKNITVS